MLDRGDRREDIFRADVDRRQFLATLSQACERTGWRVHAWVLMGNHYHLLLETPEPNLVKGMHWLQTTYTSRFNRRHRLCGHLFQGRYKSVLVEPEAPGYFATLSDYIHLNPVRARLVGLDDRLVDYRWSSYPAYATGRGRTPWLEVSRVLSEIGVEDTVSGRYRFAERMRQRAVATLTGKGDVTLRELRRGWCLGGESFSRTGIAMGRGRFRKVSQRRRSGLNRSPLARYRGGETVDECGIGSLRAHRAGASDTQEGRCAKTGDRPLHPGAHNCRKTMACV